MSKKCTFRMKMWRRGVTSHGDGFNVQKTSSSKFVFFFLSSVSSSSLSSSCFICVFVCVCVHVGVLSVVFISFFARIKKRSLVSVATTSSSSVSSGCKKTTTASLVTVSKRNFSLYFRFPMFFFLSFFQYHIVNNYGNRNQFWEGNISDPWLIE